MEKNMNTIVVEEVISSVGIKYFYYKIISNEDTTLHFVFSN